MVDELNKIKGTTKILNYIKTSLTDEVCVLLLLVTQTDNCGAINCFKFLSNKKLTMRYVILALLEERVRKKNARLSFSIVETIMAFERGIKVRDHGVGNKVCICC